MNSVVLIGNLARDPELRYSTGMNQTAICRFTVAVNDGYGERQHTSFIPVKVFGKQAENCDRYLAKGRKVAVNGRIQTDSYTNREGNKVYTTEVIANNVEFLGGGAGQGSGRTQQQPGGLQQEDPFFQEGPSYQESEPAQSVGQIPPGFTELQDDDIPF